MLSNLTFTTHPSLALKDPTSSEKGWKIVQEAVVLFDKIGLEHFTFNKLAKRAGTTEATVYRYFENKHKLLLYISNWYWGYVTHQIIMKSAVLNSPYQKLEFALKLIASPLEEADDTPLDTAKLHQIIISEGPKVYLVKEVDEENSEGVYLSYKGLCKVIAENILAINPQYKHPHTLASSLIELCHSQIFFSQHLPRLTDIDKEDYSQLQIFVLDLTSKAIHQ